MSGPVPAAEASRYLAISRELARDIYAGACPVGSLLPPEVALAKQYEVSRQTIRAAMRILGDMGLVVRRRGVGTTVIAATPIPAFSQSVGSLADLQQYAEETHLYFDRVEHVLARGALAERLGCRAGKVWLRGDAGPWHQITRSSRNRAISSGVNPSSPRISSVCSPVSGVALTTAAGRMRRLAAESATFA